jgi:hypothetical protein
MPANEVSKQDGAKRITASKVYQVVYCIEIRHPMGEAWWQSWYLLQCPLIGSNSLAEAHRKAKEWKVQFGAKFQPVIISEADGDFESLDCESLLGIGGIDGLDAGEFEFPYVLFEESGCL